MKKLKNCTAIILCGGKSRRMGFDKALLKIDGNYILKDIIESLKLIFNDVLLVNDSNEKSELLLDIFHTPVVSDHYVDCGPLGAVCTAIEATSTEYVFVTACDMPMIHRQLIEKMYDKLYDNHSMLCELNDKLEPMFAFYHKSVLDIFCNELKNHQYSIQSAKDRFAFIPYQIQNQEEKLVFTTNLNYLFDVAEYKKKGESYGVIKSS